MFFEKEGVFLSKDDEERLGDSSFLRKESLFSEKGAMLLKKECLFILLPFVYAPISAAS